MWSTGVTSNGTFGAGNPATAAFNGLASGNGSAAAITETGTDKYILVSNLGFTGSSSLKLKGTWSQVEINGVEQNPPAKTDAEHDFGTVSDLDTIKIYGSGQPATLFYVEVGGRLLVDQGVWDNSQNWSGGSTYSTNNNNPGAPIPLSRLFNGSLERPGIDGYQNTITTWTFNPIDITGKTVELYGFKEGVGSPPPEINGVSIDNFSTYGVLEWIDVTSKFTDAGVKSISEIVHNVGTQGPEIVAIKLDGAMLVDAGYQWNTSKVWSNYGSGGQTGAAGWEYTFNGDLTNGNGIYFRDNTGTYDFPAGYGGTLKIHMLSSSATAGGMTVNVKGVEKTVSFTGTYQRETLDFGNVTADIGTISFVPSGIGAQIEIELGAKSSWMAQPSETPIRFGVMAPILKFI